MKTKFEIAIEKSEPYQKYLVLGVSTAFFAGLIIFGGVWALVIAVICMFVGILLGLVVGSEMMRRDLDGEMTALRAQYEAASELAYKLNLELTEQVQRAESAERDLLATAAEKTALRAKLDGLQADGRS
ncbi:hypothetical protein [Nonomuraea sp. NPDC049504]|uniref:hypothetical protein n=1 Tax=Nonomuraea sp. NPDC049504 TaxID=3154729 RepID=UPI0034446997